MRSLKQLSPNKSDIKKKDMRFHFRSALITGFYFKILHFNKYLQSLSSRTHYPSPPLLGAYRRKRKITPAPNTHSCAAYKEIRDALINAR